MIYKTLLERYKIRLENKLADVNAILANIDHPKLIEAMKADMKVLELEHSDTGLFFDLEKLYDTLLRGGSKTRDFLILLSHGLLD